MRSGLELNGKIRVLERIEHFSGIEPKALWTDMTLGVSVARKIKRAAVVADAGGFTSRCIWRDSLQRLKSRRST
ncbi:STAS/SEC14 domain-containing protein [Burkholderia oklahomensis]|nr:STAS/SEC14 domain-containing protein [Burkholderia oklahomensis]MDN7676064.1 STAS/SEC14 domain-containing protein [Burkholderia oklahomensis]